MESREHTVSQIIDGQQMLVEELSFFSLTAVVTVLKQRCYGNKTKSGILDEKALSQLTQLQV